jgi:lipopolysaccharide export LptBFGC system permease protein LptF
MNETGELVAVDALGFSRQRIQATLLLFALLLAVINGVISLYVAPSALTKAKAVAVSTLRSAVLFRLKPKQFNRPESDWVFYFESRQSIDSFLNVFVEQTTDDNRMEVIAKSADVRISPSFDISMHFRNGRAFITRKKSGGSPSDDVSTARTTIAFKDFTLTATGTSRLSSSTGPKDDAGTNAVFNFIPDGLCVSTSTLLSSSGTATDVSMQYALWRRISSPLGFFFLALFGIIVAFGATGFHRTKGVLWSMAMFLAFHLIGRLSESFALDHTMPPPVAALLPALACAFGSLFFLGVRIREFLRIKLAA